MTDKLWDTSVYVFSAVDAHGDFTIPCKIGIAGNPFARVSTIQTACPFKIEPFFHVRAPSREFASIIEGAAHVAFSDHRAFGEWFNVHPVDASIGVLLLMKDGFDRLGYSPERVSILLQETGMTATINRLRVLRDRRISAS